MDRAIGDKAGAIKLAHTKIADLKQHHPDAAAILERQLGAYLARPASVPALLRLDGVKAFQDAGSDFANYANMLSGALDTGAVWASGTPHFATKAVAAGATALSGALGVSALLHEGPRQQSQAELDRRHEQRRRRLIPCPGDRNRSPAPVTAGRVSPKPLPSAVQAARPLGPNQIPMSFTHRDLVSEPVNENTTLGRRI